MIRAIKVRLYPTKNQEELMWKSAGVARFAYNWGLAYLNNYYEENKKSLSIGNLRKIFTELRKGNEFPWLKEVSSEIPQQALKDLGDAFNDFFKKKADYPRFKKKNKCETSFFHLNNKFVVEDKKIKLEKIGYIKKYDKLKSEKAFKKGEKLNKTNNIIKLEKKIKLLHKKISDIRLNHMHQTTNAIVKTKPSRVVVEDLNVKGLLKNKHLSKAIAEQSFNKFMNALEYKCEWYGIEFVKADRFYPSSKKCSCCNTIKKDLRLKDRTYVCPNEKCNLVIDRDKNASINLANYQLA